MDIFRCIPIYNYLQQSKRHVLKKDFFYKTCYNFLSVNILYVFYYIIHMYIHIYTYICVYVYIYIQDVSKFDSLKIL